ncbi:phosphatidic acid phosphatase [Rhizobium rhizosphaerae]|uniref:Phosphatidic acid phosphatase n=1 Tax=Xaviernesmea rhizosphaerae TaxID=1672749 RepID=A0ABX3PCD4_9HYPH|nr:phosphatase PAP2 family protein [Xaviernesmea rhizosphaerae]OQP86124.1 phosphatidic acid phosphatase [Xaviernesmea rhizosphaerae]
MGTEKGRAETSVSEKSRRVPLWTKLRRRYEARRTLHRRVPWRGFTLSALNLIAIAFFVLDTPLGQAAKSLPPPLISFAGNVTDIGKLAYILAAVTTVLISLFLMGRRLSGVRRRFRMAYLGQMTLYAALSVLVSSIVVHLLKYAIGRSRPLLFEQDGVLSFHPFSGDFLHESFPSGHSAHIGALFMALALLFPRFRLVFIGLGLWLGATRIILGVHFPSDVVAGLSLGAWLAFAVSILFARFGLVFSVDRNGWPMPRLNRVV